MSEYDTSNKWQANEKRRNFEDFSGLNIVGNIVDNVRTQLNNMENNCLVVLRHFRQVSSELKKKNQ